MQKRLEDNRWARGIQQIMCRWVSGLNQQQTISPPLLLNTVGGNSMFKNSKKQGDAGLGQAIAYFTMLGYDIALPLTDSADWDLIVEMEDGLKRVQVKTSSQITDTNVMKFNCDVKGGNKTFNKPSKKIQDQKWELIFLHHLITGKQALIPKEILVTKGQINLGSSQCKYKNYMLN
jgi:hypothetical protein